MAAGDGQKVDGGGQASTYVVPHSPNFADVYELVMKGQFPDGKRERLLTLLASERQYVEAHAHSQQLRAEAEAERNRLREKLYDAICSPSDDPEMFEVDLNHDIGIALLREPAASSGDLPSPSPWGSDKGATDAG